MRVPAQIRVLAGPGTITAIEGLTFAISDERGDIGDGPQGLIAYDTRHLSRLALTVNGAPLNHLGAGLLSSDTARFRGYPPLSGHGPDAPVEVARQRRVRDRGMDEDFLFTSWCADAIDLDVCLDVACDFADIFEVRRVPVETPTMRGRRDDDPRSGVIRFLGSALATHLTLSPPPHKDGGGPLRWRVRLSPHGSWKLTVTVDAHSPSATNAAGRLGPVSSPVARSEVRTEPPALSRAVRSSLEDFDALGLVDDLDASRRLVAAGIPWFVALFGRDSLIASYQARAFLPELSLSTLRALAARQGRVESAGNAEQPGKILHEVRLTPQPWLGDGTTGGARPYFGSIDATPLFLMALGSAWRWGLGRDAVAELLPAARAALIWMRTYGDPDGDGFLEYSPWGPRGLTNQAWKDSENAVQFADGRQAAAPIAMVEVQGYAYAARRDLAAILGWLGHDEEAVDLAGEADALRAGIRDRFWIQGAEGSPGYFAVALDADKRPVDSVSSNMGHILWCDVPTADQARQTAAHLVSADMDSGWGLRTLSRAMAGFNPISYHLGSVWPHDTAIACEGLRRYGHDTESLRLAHHLIDSMIAFDDRLPELFGGHSRAEGDFPVPYPTACRPQAWAAGVPLTLVPMLLGLEPRWHDGAISIAPSLPPAVRRLEVRGIRFPAGVLSVAIDDDGIRIIEAPPGMVVEVRPAAEHRPRASTGAAMRPSNGPSPRGHT